MNDDKNTTNDEAQDIDAAAELDDSQLEDVAGGWSAGAGQASFAATDAWDGPPPTVVTGDLAASEDWDKK